MSMDLGSFLKADVGKGDVTTALTVPDTDGTAYITCEADAVVAGIEEAEEIFSMVGADATSMYKDGDRVKAGSRIMSISGPLAGVITAERTALNILMNMSGVATMTAKAVEAAEGKIIIAATRKTVPGFGPLQKKAVAVAGGDPHRADLDSMILVKDNHIRACGSVKTAMEKLAKASFSLKIEVEVDNIDDAVTAAEMGADIIMADNVGPELTGEIRDAVKKVNDRILIEASGDMTIERVPEYIGKADIISMGCLTHSAPALQFSMDIN